MTVRVIRQRMNTGQGSPSARNLPNLGLFGVIRTSPADSRTYTAKMEYNINSAVEACFMVCSLKPWKSREDFRNHFARWMSLNLKQYVQIQQRDLDSEQ